jgi:hypothetical protein
MSPYSEGQAAVNNDITGNLSEQMVGREVSVSAIGDSERSVWCHQWTHQVSLVRLWDSEHRSMRNKEIKNTDDFTV